MKRISILLALALLLPTLVLTGCGKKAVRQVDVASGDYYTEEEFKWLSNDERDEYCEDLASELERLKMAAQADEMRQGQIADDLKKLKQKATALQGKLASQGDRFKNLEKEIAYFESLPGSYTVVKGDCLWNISGKEEIYADPIKWPRIYRANKDQISDPHWIFPKQVFAIPRECPNKDPNWHLVMPGEFLYKISGYDRIYGDPAQWPKIYEANKDEITDPNLIYPEQLFEIPR